jgi:hypothetical protein
MQRGSPDCARRLWSGGRQYLMAHVKDEAVFDAARQHVDAEKLDLIGRMEGNWCMQSRERQEMPAIALEDWSQKP